MTEYTWDHRNRLTAVVTQDSDGTVIKEAAYTYDAYDRRIAKVVDADGEGAEAPTEERFVYDGDHIALVFDGEGEQTHRYFHGPQVDQVLAEETADGETRWALTDHQGSVRDVVDNNGTILNHITYDSFGQVTSETNPDIDFRFGYTGREIDDETGLMYYRARYFDPAVGSFVSEDPLGFDAGDVNIYRYVFNSPTNYTDPSGNIPLLLALPIGYKVLAVGIPAISLWWYLNRDNINDLSKDCLNGFVNLARNAANGIANGFASLAASAANGNPAFQPGYPIAILPAMNSGYGPGKAAIESPAVLQSNNNADDGNADETGGEYDDIADELESQDQPKPPQKGKSSRNQKQQKQEFKSAISEIEKSLGKKLTKKDKRRLHDEITKEGFSRDEIIDIGINMFE